MKREKALVEQRRQKILEALKEDRSLSAEELAGILGVSAVTVRRDLILLESRNQLVRSYGGAILTEQSRAQSEFPEEVMEMRTLIARYAASLVEDNDSIFINTSRNALDIIRYIDKENVTVITNNGRALSMEHSPNIHIYLTGGEIRFPKEALVGEFAERNLLKVYARKAFIGCTGISPECGVTTENVNEVHLNELMIQRAIKETYILADYTKIGHNSSFRTCGLDKISNLITDERAPQSVLEQIRERGVKVHRIFRQDYTK